MKPDSEVSSLFDSAAEAIVMVDVAETDSVAALVGLLSDIAALFGPLLAEDHPGAGLVRAGERYSQGDESALPEINRFFGLCKQEIESISAVETSSPKSADRPAKAKRTRAVPPAPAPAPAPAQAMPLAGDDDLLRDFAIRSVEHLDDADERLLVLEIDPADADALDAVFRAFHTIKGMAGFLALDAISEFAHDSESLLAEARTTGTAVPSASIPALFSAVDRMRTLVDAAVGVGPRVDAVSDLPDAGREVITPAEVDRRVQPAGRRSVDAEAGISTRAGTVRVDESRLDALVEAIGEMVIAQSMVSASTRNGTDAATLELQTDRLDKITRELQQMATSLRMVPLRATFRRMARLVRDVAAKDGKRVEFVLVGEDTELDKVVVDRLSDPLIHALRNAVDHGIESPAQRRAAGKPECGRVELSASHAGGVIQVRVTDDGRGVDPEQILAKARDRGLVAEDETPDDRALFDLLYSPGFSTAKAVTDVSGRGVGMDVVRRTVEELRGRVELRSVLGEGSALEIRLPLTLAIIDGMILRVGGERYVLPVAAIERSVRPTAETIATVVGHGEMLTLADGLVPILRLHALFSTPDAETDLTNSVVVIVNDNGVRAGLVACELLGQQQTVIKPLGEGLPDHPGIAGGSIMPDGRVGLILDAAGLIRTAQQVKGGKA